MSTVSIAPACETCLKGLKLNDMEIVIKCRTNGCPTMMGHKLPAKAKQCVSKNCQFFGTTTNKFCSSCADPKVKLMIETIKNKKTKEIEDDMLKAERTMGKKGIDAKKYVREYLIVPNVRNKEVEVECKYGVIARMKWDMEKDGFVYLYNFSGSRVLKAGFTLLDNDEIRLYFC